MHRAQASNTASSLEECLGEFLGVHWAEYLKEPVSARVHSALRSRLLVSNPLYPDQSPTGSVSRAACGIAGRTYYSVGWEPDSEC